MNPKKEANKFDTCFLTTKHLFWTFICCFAFKLITTFISLNFSISSILTLTSYTLFAIAIYKGDNRSILSILGLVAFGLAQIPIEFLLSGDLVYFWLSIFNVFPFLILLILVIIRRFSDMFEFLFIFPPIFCIMFTFVGNLMAERDMFSVFVMPLVSALLYLILSYWFNGNAKDDNRAPKEFFKDTFADLKKFTKSPAFAVIIFFAVIIAIVMVIILIDVSVGGGDTVDKCASCNGAGRVGGLGNSRTCPTCKGTGIPPL